MQCPKCQSPADDLHTSAGITVNFCRGCKGLWFDPGELTRYCPAESVTRHLPARLKTARPTSLYCPRCTDTLLAELPYQEGRDILIDCCPVCYGVWLDAGELLQVQQLARAVQSPPGSGPAVLSTVTEIDWRQGCGWIGSALLLVGIFLPFVDSATAGSLSLFALLKRSCGSILGPVLVGVLSMFPLVLTCQKQYGWLGTFGLGVSGWLTLSQVIPFLIETLELWPPEFLAVMRWSPRYGVEVLLVGAGHLMLANTPTNVIRRLSRIIAGGEVQITLRDELDERCLEHLEPVLASLRASQQKFQTDLAADWCAVHHCRMQLHTWYGQLYWGHRLDTGQWCGRKAPDA